MEVRVNLVREAVEELWGKIGDMQAGMVKLSAQEWEAVLERVRARMAARRERGQGPPSSVEER
jgi:hypothetical protein